jgi:hypothetical protein
MNIDIGRSVTYALEDPEWPKKLGILALIGFVPGLNVIVWGGYAMTIARRIMRQEQPILPEWTDWSDIAVRGLLAIAATFIYYVPVILVSCCLSLIGTFSGRDSGLATVLQCCIGVVSIVYALAVNLVLNVGHVRFVQSDQFNSYLDIRGRIDDLRADSDLFAALFVYQTIFSVLTAVASAVLAITCIGIVVVATVGFLANGYLLGSAAAASARRPRRVGR